MKILESKLSDIFLHTSITIVPMATYHTKIEKGSFVAKKANLRVGKNIISRIWVVTDLGTAFVVYTPLAIAKLPFQMRKMQIFSGFAALNLRMWKIMCNFASKIFSGLAGGGLPRVGCDVELEISKRKGI